MKNKETHAGGVHYIEIYFFKFGRLKIEDHGVNRFGLQEVLLICREPPYVYTSLTLVLSVSRSSLLMGTPFRLDQVYLIKQIALLYLNYLFKDLFPNRV